MIGFWATGSCGFLSVGPGRGFKGGGVATRATTGRGTTRWRAAGPPDDSGPGQALAGTSAAQRRRLAHVRQRAGGVSTGRGGAAGGAFSAGRPGWASGGLAAGDSASLAAAAGALGGSRRRCGRGGRRGRSRLGRGRCSFRRGRCGGPHNLGLATRRPAGQVAHGPMHLRNHRRCCLRRRSDSGSGPAAAFLHQLLHEVALVRVQAAKLILHIDADLAAEVEQVFALHIQFPRQGIHTYFLFLRAQLLCRQSRRNVRRRPIPGHLL